MNAFPPSQPRLYQTSGSKRYKDEGRWRRSRVEGVDGGKRPAMPVEASSGQTTLPLPMRGRIIRA